MINQINNIAYITNNLMDRQVNELMNSYINKYMDKILWNREQTDGMAREKVHPKINERKRRKNLRAKQPCQKCSLSDADIDNCVSRSFRFLQQRKKRKKSWKKKWIEWSELVPVRVEGAEAPVSQLEEGQAANLPFFYHRRRSRGAALALTLPQEGGQAFPPSSYQKEDYGYKLSALL